MNTLPFSKLVEINPHVKIEKLKEYPFVEMGIVEPGRRYVRTTQSRIFQSGGAKFLSGDTLFARITPCLENGKIAQYQNADGQAGFGSTEFFVFRARPGVSDSGFVYYLAKSDLIRKPAEKSMSGASGRQRADIKSIVDLEVPSPPLPIQRKIAAILSAYDDLIENNLRRIKILEEVAQNLYYEWFVKFRYPGHTQVRLIDSPQGKIPKGWEVVRYSDLLVSGLGGDWGLDEPDDKENVPVFVIRGTDFADIVSGSPFRTPKRFIATSSHAKRQLINGDLLVENSINAKSRCVGKTLLITDGILQRLSLPVIAASFCKVYRFKNPFLATLAHLHMRYLYKDGRMAFYQNVAANGIGNFQSQRFLESEHLVFPSDPQMQQKMFAFLNDLTSSTFADQVFTIRHTRDLLLPKLISGEVDVSELDINIPEVNKP